MPRWPDPVTHDLGTLAGRVRWARTRRGMSQQQLADLARVSLVTVNRIERDPTRPAPYPVTRAALADALRVSLNWLETGAGKPGRGLELPTENGPAAE